MLYGEVFADDIDPPCGEDPGQNPCVTGKRLVYICFFFKYDNMCVLYFRSLGYPDHNVHVLIDSKYFAYKSAHCSL